jgi:hypothetical protein
MQSPGPGNDNNGPKQFRILMDEVLWLGETDRRLGNDGAMVGQTDSRFLDYAVAVAPATE